MTTVPFRPRPLRALSCLVLGVLAMVSLTPPLAARAQSLDDPTAAPVPRIDTDMVVLRWLDKSTARVAQVRVPVGEPVMLGGVQVIARACRRTALDESPEHAAFLDIGEVHAGTPSHQTVFRGWMFASSPSLSAMEHPVYDVWVVECVDDADDGVGVLPVSPPPVIPSKPDIAPSTRSAAQ
ncbi:hypothetical protein GGD89_001247 [Roseospira visakhapatnamensis]|uniref:DUF2155 domain-containing protein n=1 Tax=Roseospira visakhapatnamensis TaxID=390880 RepID=A0A7W6W917_9PROT|nr:hypothetical protein [Roseospira visakhapatnamensis]